MCTAWVPPRWAIVCTTSPVAVEIEPNPVTVLYVCLHRRREIIIKTRHDKVVYTAHRHCTVNRITCESNIIFIHATMMIQCYYQLSIRTLSSSSSSFLFIFIVPHISIYYDYIIIKQKWHTTTTGVVRRRACTSRLDHVIVCIFYGCSGSVNDVKIVGNDDEASLFAFDCLWIVLAVKISYIYSIQVGTLQKFWR